MLTVDVEKRITVDECLEHPWITQKPLGLTDSTDGLTGAMGQLDFSKRKVQRERTLLSSLADVKISKIIELGNQEPPVKVFEKKLDGKRLYDNVSAGNEVGLGGANGVEKEVGPAANRAPMEFMEMGGKGDQPLFGDDKASRHEPDEAPR